MKNAHPFRWDVPPARSLCIACIYVTLLATPASADTIRMYDSYHGFFVYGFEQNAENQATLQNDAVAMMNAFATQGWTTTLYGPGEAAGELNQALLDMLLVPAPDELLFFYYSGHGGGVHGGGQDDSDQDESQVEDPIPPGFGGVDDTDETLAYGENGEFIQDDAFGAIIDQIQASSNFVSGAIDACHANGMLDGSSDARGFPDKESVWTTAATEWETAAFGCPNSPFTEDLLKALDPLNPLTTLGHLFNWFTDNGEMGHSAAQTYGVKFYEGVEGTKLYYPADVPEPSTVLLVALGVGYTLRARVYHRRER